MHTARFYFFYPVKFSAAALYFAIAMHLLLLVILGPWGLNHSWGVLLWNAMFVVQNVGLIRAGRAESNSISPAETSQQAPRPAAGWSLAQLVCLVVFILPLGERLGLVDHWLGWALYAPHSSRATIEIAQPAVERLPDSINQYFGPTDPLGWRRLAVDQWSLKSLGVPMYPQQRFYVGVARSLAEHVDELEIQVVLQSVSNRFTGRRQTTELSGRRQLEQAATGYWFGTTGLGL